MITVRRADERGRFDFGWLDTRHTFSFGDYRDPAHMGFRTLRVINEDRIRPGEGFPTHSHRDMEILTVILEGALEHKDSMGNGAVIRPGEVQRMSAGTGVTHSEVNPSQEEEGRFLQIWILPERTGIEPGYEQAAFPAGERRGILRLVASRDGREGSLTLHQDADVFLGALGGGKEVRHALRPGRGAWIQVATGSVELNGTLLGQGDGAAVEEEQALHLRARSDAEILLFDLG